MYQIDIVQHGWVADSEVWSVVGPLFDQRLRPLLADLPWLRGTAFTLDFVFLKRYRCGNAVFSFFVGGGGGGATF